jgi:hypothetical protein
MTTAPHFEMTISNKNDLSALWTRLMGPDGFGRRTVWLAFLDRDNRTLPMVVPIDDVPAEPEPAGIRMLAELVGGVVGTGDAAFVVVLLSRDGSAAMTSADRRWATALSTGLGQHTSPWPVHLATRGRIQIVAPDDLVRASS